MKLIILPLLIVLILVSAGCGTNEEPGFIDSGDLIGYWGNPVVNDSIWTYERIGELKEHEYGFGFKSGQVFVERKNSGWCGTPPIAYANFEGFWLRNESTIDITTEYWGGIVDYQWKIVSLDNYELRVVRVKEEYRSVEN